MCIRDSDLFEGYKRLAMVPDELVEWLRVPDTPTALSFEKVSKRTHLDIASVNSAMAVVRANGVVDQAHVSAGGVAPVPLYLEQTSRFLEGRQGTPETARQAAELAASEISPIDDVRGSAEYRRLLLGQLVLAHCNRLFGLEEGAP